MVKIVTPEENRIPLQTMLPEAMISCTGDWGKDFEWCDVLVIGPGIGMTAKAADKVEFFLKKAKQEKKQVVLDANGLNLLAENPKWKNYLGRHVILTPHMGEMSRLTGKSISELKSDRAGAARALAAETGVVCVLKDACTVTAAPDGRAWISLSGNAGMATEMFCPGCLPVCRQCIWKHLLRRKMPDFMRHLVSCFTERAGIKLQ